MIKLYKKKTIQPAEEWREGFNMDGVSVSDADKAKGSPKEGDMIAHNPRDPSDKWLIEQAAFAETYEPFEGCSGEF